MKSKNFIIPLVIYPFEIMVSIGETDAQFLKSIQKHLPPECIEDLKDEKLLFHMGVGNIGRTAFLSTGHQTIIRIPYQVTTCEQYGTLAHEIFHAIDLILQAIGIKLSNKSSECYAYLIGYVTQEIYKKM